MTRSVFNIVIELSGIDMTQTELGRTYTLSIWIGDVTTPVEVKAFVFCKSVFTLYSTIYIIDQSIGFGAGLPRSPFRRSESPFRWYGQVRTKYNRLLDDGLQDDQIIKGPTERSDLVTITDDMISSCSAEILKKKSEFIACPLLLDVSCDTKTFREYHEINHSYPRSTF